MENDNLIKYETYLIGLIISYCNENHILISDYIEDCHDDIKLRIEWHTLICLSKNITLISYQQWLSEIRKNKINNLLQ